MNFARTLSTVASLVLLFGTLGFKPPQALDRAKLDGAEQEITSLVLAPNGRWVAAGCFDGKVCVWDVDKNKLIHTISAHDNVRTMAGTADGKILATGGGEGNVRLWEPETGRELKTFPGDREVSVLAFSPDGKTLYVGCQDHLIHVWDVEAGDEVDALSGHESYMHSFAVTADGTTLASVGFENERPNEIFLWDLEKREVKSRFQGADFWPGYVVFSPDEKTLAVAGTRLKLPSDISGVVTLWDVATGKQEKESKRIPLSVDAVAYAPDGKLLAIATALDEVELWNAETLEPVTKLTGHTNSVSHVAFSADGKLIASASRDKTVRLWNVPPKGAAATKGATGKTKGTKPTKPSKKK